MMVSFVDLKARYFSIKDEIDSVIQQVIEDSAFIGGKYLKSFENNFASYCQAEHCVGVGNGTDALFLALKALGIGRGDEVITPANSFVATSEAITRAGAKVVFVDCDRRTYNIDVNLIESKITSCTKAIIPVHLYGQPADLVAIREIADQHKIYIVQDCAQAHGAAYAGKPLADYGDILCFSFYPGKNLGAYGDAGAIVTNNEELAIKIRMFANHGCKDKYAHEFEGVNSRMDGMQAAILDVKLKYLDKWIRVRQKAAHFYDEHLQGKIVVPHQDSLATHVYHLYVIQTENRGELQIGLKERGIATGIHYPIPLPMLDAYSYLGHVEDDFPVTCNLASRILSLPMHGSITDQEVEYVTETISRLVPELLMDRI